MNFALIHFRYLGDRFLHSDGTDFLTSLLQKFQPQRQLCIKIRLPWAQKFYTPLVLGGATVSLTIFPSSGGGV